MAASNLVNESDSQLLVSAFAATVSCTSRSGVTMNQMTQLSLANPLVYATAVNKSNAYENNTGTGTGFTVKCANTASFDSSNSNHSSNSYKLQHAHLRVCRRDQQEEEF